MKIEVLLSEKEFSRFSWFDVLHCRKVWRSPAVFAAIFGISALVCFLMRKTPGSAALGSVLLIVGLGIPAAYFLSFFLSLRRQAKAQGLGEGKYVYTLELDDNGIAVDNSQEHTTYPWEQILHAYRNSTATYLYITPQRAFLIPHKFVCGGADVLWDFIASRIPAQRQTVL